MRLFPFLFALLLFLRMGGNAYAQKGERMSLTFVEYNCENLFDCSHDSLKNDYDFLPEGNMRWTRSRYWKKLNDIGRVVQQCGGSGKEWRLPDLVALVEVENDSTIQMLTRVSMLAGAGYRYVMTRSEDERGVDVALLYNPFTFRTLSHYPLRITPPKGYRHTRDILYVCGQQRNGDTLHVFVVHAPSRRGGKKATEDYRLAVAGRLTDAVDSLRRTTENPSIVIAGDFNDYTGDKALRALCARQLVDVTENAIGLNDRNITGTYKYQGRWDSLDHIFLSEPLARNLLRSFVYDAPWLLQDDARGGKKPRRTYLGTAYNGGVSDHLPLVIGIGMED